MRDLSEFELTLIQGARTKAARCLDSYAITDLNSGINALIAGSVVCSMVEVADVLRHPWRLL